MLLAPGPDAEPADSSAGSRDGAATHGGPLRSASVNSLARPRARSSFPAFPPSRALLTGGSTFRGARG
jgi:hypothetical protein